MASRGVNKVILIGHLGSAPEVRYTNAGKAVATFGLATTERWRDKQTGENQEQTEWHRVVLFGPLAEIAEKWLQKGSQVYIEGSLRTRKWQDKQQHERQTTEIVAREMKMLGGRSGGDQGGGRHVSQPAQAHQANQATHQTATADAGGTSKASAQQEPLEDDDIPF